MRRWLAVLAASFCAACVKPIALDGNIRPSVSVPEGKSSEKAGVLCTEDLLDHVERASPNTPAGFTTTYELELGQPLCDVLLRSVESSHRAAHRAGMMPLRGQYGRVVRFGLQKSALSIERRGNGTMRIAYTLSVVVERFGRDLERLGTNVVSGNALVDAPKATDELVQQAVESALQQVADGASSLLVARIEGPRVQRSP